MSRRINETFRDQIVHERMLLGAIDSYLSELVHTRPFLASSFREQLEALADHWLEGGGTNELDAIDASWLQGYLAGADDPVAAHTATTDFFRWATREALLAHNPLDAAH